MAAVIYYQDMTCSTTMQAKKAYDERNAYRFRANFFYIQLNAMYMQFDSFCTKTAITQIYFLQRRYEVKHQKIYKKLSTKRRRLESEEK